jgi:hypothetical protein
MRYCLIAVPRPKVLAIERNAAPKTRPAKIEVGDIRRILFIISVSVSPVGLRNPRIYNGYDIR